jgi:fructose-1,6-bisphosphatase/inositol monophosphatase family enzyme
MPTAFSAADLADLLAILIAAADAEILPRFQCLGDDDVGTKSGPMDLVTVADRAAEKRIAAAVAKRFPDAAFVGEETVAEDPSCLDLLASADLAVVVDPIDGTFNFASGLPLFGVMAAVVAGGETVAGVILDPIGGGHMTAMKGEGAHLGFRDGRPSRRLRVAAAEAVGDMHGCVSWSYMPGSLRETVATRMARLAATYNYRCAAHEYRLAATGACHLLAYGKLMPWDHLAGALIHAEAGGYSAKFDGSPYRPTDLTGGLLLAPDEASWQAVHAAVFAN